MSIEDLKKVSIQKYLTKEKAQPIYKVKVRPTFSPLDIITVSFRDGITSKERPSVSPFARSSEASYVNSTF